MDIVSLQPNHSIIPYLISPYSGTPLYYINWVEEVEKVEQSKFNVIKIIYFYTFIISCIVKALSYMNPNPELQKLVDKYYSLLKNDFINDYFKKVSQYEFFNLIIKFIHSSANYTVYGVYDNIDDTAKFYNSINHYFDMCFKSDGEKIELINIINVLNINDSNENINKIRNNAKEIKIPNISFNGILHLLLFFETKIMSYHITSDIIPYGDLTFTNLVILNRLSIDITSLNINNDNQNVNNNIDSLKDLIIKHDTEIKDLITKESMKISNEIIKSFHSIPEEYRSECAEKIWMFARHPEFFKPFKKLVEKGFITKEPMNYKFNFDLTKKGKGKNILAYFIFIFADLTKWADSSKSDNKPKDSDDFTGFFTKRVYEPFSIAFNIPNLERNIADKDKPKEWDEFKEKAELKDLEIVWYAKNLF